MTHYVYKTIFEDGHYYIGVRKLPKGLSPQEDVYMGSGRALRSKLQTEAAKKQVLSEGLSKHEAYQLEKELVNYQTLEDPLCLNLVLGGRGGYLETVPLKRRWQRDSQKLAAAIQKTAFKRRGKTKETDPGLAAMAAQLSGRTKHEYEYLASISKKLSGRTKQTHVYLQEAGIKISQRLRGRKKPNHSAKLTGVGNPSYRLNKDAAKALKAVQEVPKQLLMKKHAAEKQNEVIRLAKMELLRADIAKATGIPESTVNAFISKVIKHVSQQNCTPTAA